MRIVSLCPSLTELVFDLGLGDDLVGITKFCCHPADRVGAVEQVGGTKDPKLARIRELAPDLVLLNNEENRRADAEELAAAGIPCHTSMPRTPIETAEMVRSIGVALNRPAEAELIAIGIEEHSARVRAAAAERSPVRFAYLIWRKPWMSVNADTFVHALLAQAGGINVFGGREERYPEIAAKDLVTTRPDRVLLSSEPFPFAEQHIRELADLTGLFPERFRLVDGEYLSWHGSRTPAGVDYAETVLT